ncbi:transcriptional repressor [Patescibacteria group bacterium]|nr:transcriptional repressor [Patescibacteria group bacterium]
MSKKGIDAAALLRDAGVRATPQRIRIVEILHARHRPLSIEALVSAGKGVFDMTTAYRAVETLWKSGVVRRIDLKQQHALYELAEDHHHHAVCTSCGAIQDVSMCISPSLDEKVRRAVGFSRVDSHALEFFGICNACAKK